MSLRQKAYEMWLNSPFPKTFHKRDQDMAYLLDFPTYDAIRLEDAREFLSCFDAFGKTLFGWPVYIGPWAPPDGMLFLPERTVRSMAGIIPA